MTKIQLTAILILILSFILTTALERRLIPFLRKNAKQPIYEGGPSWHTSKSGTPTMGGIAFLIVAVVLLLFFGFSLIQAQNYEAAISILSALLFSALNSAVGIIDDLTKLKRKENAGLSPKQKLVLQFLIAAIFILFRGLFLGINTAVSLAFIEFDLGVLYYPIMIIMLVGLVNCANLTDGIDGLAASVAFSASLSLLAITGFKISDISFISCLLIGAMLGFLIFNFHPAKIFMGDTGSLFIGAMLASSSMSLKNPLLIIPVCGVYVIEGISVILQVFFYKLTGRRIFKMAPLHHHLEKSGLSEKKICVLGAVSTFAMSAIAYFLYQY